MAQRDLVSYKILSNGKSTSCKTDTLRRGIYTAQAIARDSFETDVITVVVIKTGAIKYTKRGTILERFRHHA